jgi:integral membrane protein (TIGR01906 family)
MTATADGRPTVGRRLQGIAVAVSTALVITGLTIAVFFNPVWVSFGQARADAAAWTGWPAPVVDSVTREIVAEVWLGPGTFAQAVAGVPVFEARERAHMADVRRVVMEFYALVVAAAAVLFLAGVMSRGAPWFWRAVGTGSKLLAIGTVAIGITFAIFFDTAFTIFHEFLFPAGSWTFDPATDRLVQLFPDQFWTETSIAIAVVGLLLATGTWLVARRFARRGPSEVVMPVPLDEPATAARGAPGSPPDGGTDGAPPEVGPPSSPRA